jgi:uncharacterized protein YacL
MRDKITLYVIRGIFFLAAVGLGLYIARTPVIEEGNEFWGMVFAGLAALAVILAEVFFAKSPISTVSSIVFGLFIGLLMAQLFVGVITLMGDFDAEGPVIRVVRVILTLVFCYFGVTYLLQTKDNFKFIIPYVEFSKETRGQLPLVLDTSAIIDGRFADLCEIEFVDDPLVVPQFIIEELHGLSDSKDRLKRSKGRRGLDILNRLRSNSRLTCEILEEPVPEVEAVDEKLIAICRRLEGRLVTTDYNLERIGEVHKIKVLNINKLAQAVRTPIIPGDRIKVKLIKAGEEEDQGVGYLEDGTMVVIEKGLAKIGQEVQCVVTNALQTNTGRMVFGKLA